MTTKIFQEDKTMTTKIFQEDKPMTMAKKLFQQAEQLYSEKIIPLTFGSITTNNKGKKTPLNLPNNHTSISLSQSKKQWNINHTCLAIRTGKDSNITALDFDRPKQGEEQLVDGLEIFEKLKHLQTPIVKTPNGGFHIYFQYEPSLKSSTKVVFDNQKSTIDIRNDGGLLFAPPSSYEGRSYEWVNSFTQYKPKKIPAELLEKLQKTNVKKENNPKIKENSNNNEIISLMKMISSEKRKNYGDWLDVGIILYSIYGGGDEGLYME